MYDLREFLKSIEGTSYSFYRSNFQIPIVTGVIFVPNFRFRCFRITDIVFVSGVTVFDLVSEKKYENENGFCVYRSFPTVFTPRYRVQPLQSVKLVYQLSSRSKAPQDSRMIKLWNLNSTCHLHLHGFIINFVLLCLLWFGIYLY